MSTRTRTRRTDQSYTARLRQRSAAPRRRRSMPPWLTSPHGPALLALAAELGHLGAALIEWPTSTARGVLHILAAAALGFVAVGAYFGSRRLARPAGIVIGVALLTGSVVAALTGVSLYRDFSFGTAVIGVEVVLVVFLAGLWRAPAPTPSCGRTQLQRGRSRRR